MHSPCQTVYALFLLFSYFTPISFSKQLSLTRNPFSLQSLLLYPDGAQLSSHVIDVLHFELYTDRKMPDIEAQIEAVFDRHGLYYDKSEVWIAEERLYEVLYEMEVTHDE